MAHILVNLTHGPEHPFRAALGFLMAATACEKGHQVSIFLAGDATQLIRDAVIDNLVGLGSGELRSHFDKVRAGNGRIYLSKLSGGARGVSDDDIVGKGAEFVMPQKLFELVLEADKVLTY